jgi:hypothetical protein
MIDESQRCMPWQTIAKAVTGAASWLPREEAEASADCLQLIPAATVQDEHMRYHVFRRIRSGQAYLTGRLSVTVGGHIEPGDCGTDLETTIRNTLQRELLEEIGITAAAGKPETAVFDPRSKHLAVVHRVITDQTVRNIGATEFSNEAEGP